MQNKFLYVEVRNAQLELIGIIDNARSMIWHSVFYACGDFDIEIAASKEMRELLTVGNFISRYDSDDIGIIEAVEISMTDQGENIIVARGRFAKCLLERRLIYRLSGSTNTATVFNGDVQTAVRKLVNDNAISCDFDSKRNISILSLGDIDPNITAVVVDGSGNAAYKQVSYQNLMKYTDELLQEYEAGARIKLSDDNRLLYECYKGRDLSTDYIFSAEFDNLLSVSQSIDKSAYCSTALIGGAGEGAARFYSLIGGELSDLERHEVFIDDSSISKTFKDDSGTDQEYSDSVYKKMLDSDGLQKLSDLQAVENFECKIDISRSGLKVGEDFNVGDIVTVLDNSLDIYAKMRFLEITEVRDESGYNADAVMGV